jgi:hypothetical protein
MVHLTMEAFVQRMRCIVFDGVFVDLAGFPVRMPNMASQVAFSILTQTYECRELCSPLFFALSLSRQSTLF